MKRRAVRRCAVLGCALALPAGLGSCGSKGSVALSASIDSPVAAVVSGSALAASVSGGFNLRLELGAYAPSGTDVSPSQGNFNLVKPADQSSLLVLKLTSSQAPPFHLEPGGKATVAFTFADTPGGTAQEVSAEALKPICDTKTVEIVGSITDSASRTPTPVTSLSFDVTGCP